MKNFSFFLPFLLVPFFSIAVTAQSWMQQQANGLPNSEQVIFSAVDSNVCWGINYTHFIRTTNGGTNWTDSTITGTTGFFSCISALDANTTFAGMNDYTFSANGGVFKTTDGGQTWTKQTTAFPGPGGYPKVIHFFDSNNGVVIGDPHNGNWEIYTTTNGGTQWDSVPSANIPAPGIYAGISEMINAYASAENIIWFFTDGPFINSVRRMYRSTDRGLTWSANPNYVLGCAFKDSLNGLATVENQHIYRTTDGGITWTLLQNVPTTPSTFFISYVKGTPGSYIITSPSSSVSPGSMYSADDGTSWEPIDNLPHGPASFSNDGSGWSGGLGDIIYKWIPPTVPVELTSFIAQAQESKVILNWITATEINNLGFEIQRKFESGTFATIGFVSGEGTTTNQKEYFYTDKNLTDGKYSYRLKQVDFNGDFEYSNIIEVDVRSLDNFTLEQNYPNPFNPTTTIGYVLQDKGNVKLSLINSIGEEIELLVNEEQEKGYHKVEFDGKNLSSGVYYYQLKADGLVQTKKLILMK